MKNLLLLLCLFVACTLSAQQADTSKLKEVVISDSVFQKVEIEASFPGGEQVWNKYIQSVIEKNIDKIIKDKKSIGTCEVQFIVDKDGSVTNVEALTLKNSYLAKVFIKAVKEGPKWVPAYQFGKTVKAWRRQKVTILPPEK